MGDAVEVEELDEPVEVSDFHATSTVPYPPVEVAPLVPVAGSDAVDGHDELSVPGMGDAVEVEELDEPVQRPDLDGVHSAPGAQDQDPQAGAAQEQASESEQPQPADMVQEASMPEALEADDEEPDDEEPDDEPQAVDGPDHAAEPQPEGAPQVEVADGVMQAPQLLATPVLDDTEDLATWSALVAQHRAEGTYTPVRDLPASESESESESEREDGSETVSAAHEPESVPEPEPDSEPEPDVELAQTAAAPVRISEPREVMDGGYGWGSAAPIADGAMPVGHPVKANWHWMKFQAPGDPWYDRMTPDVWFVDAQTARDNGFSRD